MQVLAVFRDRFKDEMDEKNRVAIEAKLALEENRSSGKIFGVLLAP
jgi:hypothetical protein